MSLGSYRIIYGCKTWPKARLKTAMQVLIRRSNEYAREKDKNPRMPANDHWSGQRAIALSIRKVKMSYTYS